MGANKNGFMLEMGVAHLNCLTQSAPLSAFRLDNLR
jgi:hypothetical protein